MSLSMRNTGADAVKPGSTREQRKYSGDNTLEPDPGIFLFEFGSFRSIRTIAGLEEDRKAKIKVGESPREELAKEAEYWQFFPAAGVRAAGRTFCLESELELEPSQFFFPAPPPCRCPSSLSIMLTIKHSLDYLVSFQPLYHPLPSRRAFPRPVLEF